MKKNYNLVALLFVAIMAAVPSVLPTLLKANQPKTHSANPWVCKGADFYWSSETFSPCPAQAIVGNQYCWQHVYEPHIVYHP